ncbi:TlyA family RNA methyltransferase [Cognatazoarcus halotolerans]|uniref:TlyA family RNA methyltransferase n=1 Tax=Cognatazoarcus halotolerans TaxID=2686016 RepID=UPI00190F7F73|nr:TlyA family RNA methyltransferase [Cognatazoarcus halotolerans]MBX3678882.1 TlyA family RNA methyltransferase [Rhodocyclaceae bacterium]MCB1900959.1 TlyA family RNA methyltransferase [Rhodocyclaceae bacterium]MCP5307907.1 TlyA family RNA methyltransferase [Zoogloeaceae bacterium]
MLVSRGLAPSRTAAQRMISAGRVRADGGQVTKASLEVADSAELEVVADDEDRFVSRGGLKLAGALTHTGLDVTGMRCLDVGQSTGGFSDCLLQAGAAEVIGIDVGHDQLHPRLRAEPRLRCLEGINARNLSAQDLGAALPKGGFELVTCDASFISLGLLMPRWPGLLSSSGRVLALVKPQFEVGPKGLGKGGIVRDERLFEAVRTNLCSAAESAGLDVLDYFDSPITGGDGNREFFIFAARKAG